MFGETTKAVENTRRQYEAMNSVEGDSISLLSLEDDGSLGRSLSYALEAASNEDFDEGTMEDNVFDEEWLEVDHEVVEATPEYSDENHNTPPGRKYFPAYLEEQSICLHKHAEKAVNEKEFKIWFQHKLRQFSRECNLELYLPALMIDRLARRVFEESQEEPYGLHGCELVVGLIRGHRARTLGQTKFDSETTPTFQVHVTLTEGRPRWYKVTDIFTNFLQRVLNDRAVYISPEWSVKKNRLYRLSDTASSESFSNQFTKNSSAEDLFKCTDAFSEHCNSTSS